MTYSLCRNQRGYHREEVRVQCELDNMLGLCHRRGEQSELDRFGAFRLPEQFWRRGQSGTRHSRVSGVPPEQQAMDAHADGMLVG